MQNYSTDLTDNQWSKVEKLFDTRKRKHSVNNIQEEYVEVIFQIVQ